MKGVRAFAADFDMIDVGFVPDHELDGAVDLVIDTVGTLDVNAKTKWIGRSM